AIARAVDDRAQTREVLSTAVCVADRADAWSRAAVEHARAASRRIVLRDAFPARAPRRWPAPLIAAAIYGAIWPLPQGDVMGLLAKAQAEEQQQQELVEAKAQVEAIESEIEKALSQIEDGDLREELEGAETPEPRNAEDVRRQAMKRLTSLKDRLEEMNRGAKNEQLEAMRRQMEKLRQPGPGPLNEMVQSLQQGDFQSARENLEKLMEQMQNGDLSEEQKSRLEAQMKELAQQLEKIAEDRKSLEDELQKNGLDPELAADPEALKEALEQMKNLTDEQKTALMEKAEAMAPACKN
ncbi:MAG: hypothetical protein VYC34_10335, partial [Planctomycetota bacterium]|nr:hypothetical protein [Planctomycetota bacterium]